MNVSVVGAPVKVLCSVCSLRELCLPIGLAAHEITRLDTLIRQRRRIKKGEILFHAQDAFSSLFAVRSGFFKTELTSADGRGHVTGFFMSGELMGLDGLCDSRHHCAAIALEDSEVCELPYARLEEYSADIPSLQRHFLQLMSREIVRDQDTMLLLGNMKADERLAAFLLNLSRRLSARGFAEHEFHLRMSREEIGSFLGLKLETVSRTFSRFQQEGLISVKQRHITLCAPDALRARVSGVACA